MTIEEFGGSGPRAVTQAEALRAEFEEMPVVTASFPLVFPNGKVWTVYVMSCKACDEPIPEGETRGVVTRLAGKDYRSTGSVDIDAYGYCEMCDHYTHAHHIFHGDLTMTEVRRDGNRTFKAAPTWWDRLLCRDTRRSEWTPSLLRGEPHRPRQACLHAPAG